MNAGRRRQVPGRSGLGRHGEDIAPCPEQRAAAVGGDLEVGDAPADVDDARAAAIEVLGDGDGDLLGPLAGQIQFVDPAAILVDDGRVAHRRELHVELRVVRQLLRLLRGQVVAVEVHPAAVVPVGGEVDLVALPHRDDVERRVVRQVGRRLRLEVVEPDVVGHTAPVPLPGAELAEDAVVDQLGAVGRERAEAAAREGHFLEGTPVDGGQVELPAEVVPLGPPGPEQDLAAVLPSDDEVVRPHTVRHVVAVQGGGPGHAFGDAAHGRHDVDLGVAVVLAREGQRAAVGRKPGEHLEADVARQAARDASRGGNGEEVTGVGKHDLVAGDRGKPQQP